MEDLSKITKNFGQKMIFEKKNIVILKEQNMGYHPMVLSQFSMFWWKSTFLEGGGA